MDPQTSISTANIILFLAALFGAIASYARPIRSPYAEDRCWNRWNLSILGFVGYLWMLLVIILFSPLLGDQLAAFLTEGDELPMQTRSISATFFMQVGLIGLILFAVQRRGWSLKSFFRAGGVPWGRVIRHSGHLFLRFLPAIWLVGIFWGGILLALRELGFDATPQPQLAVQWIADSDSVVFLVVMGLMVVLAAPFSEELVFRGFLYRFLDERGPARFALIFSSLLFALLHASLNSFLPLFFIGLLLVKIYDDTHDIRVPILFHLYFNLFSFLNILFLP